VPGAGVWHAVDQSTYIHVTDSSYSAGSELIYFPQKELLELKSFLVPAVRTPQNPGTSANSSRNYEKVPPVWKPLFTQPNVIPNSAECKRIYFEECWGPNNIGTHWLSLYETFSADLGCVWGLVNDFWVNYPLLSFRNKGFFFVIFNDAIWEPFGFPKRTFEVVL